MKLATAVSATVAGCAMADLSFNLTAAGYENAFLRTEGSSSAAQIVITAADSSESAQRFVAAFPQGNSGVLAYFLDSDNSTSNPLNINLVNGSLTSVSGGNDSTHAGVSGKLSLNANASLGVAILGDVRAMRDYTEGSGLMHEIFNYTLGDHNETSVSLNRQWINGTNTMNFTLSSADGVIRIEVEPSKNATIPPKCNFVLTKPNADLDFKVQFTEEPIGSGIDPSDLFLPGKVSDENVAAQVSFLTYSSKFLAGGWRFLTYFGRDSMYALRLFMSILQPDPIEDAFAAVLERLYVNGTNTSPVDPVVPGEVCHEETIGDYASFVNIGNNQSAKGNTPFYSYPMVDTDFLMLPSLSYYFLTLEQGKGRADSFLGRKSSLQFTSGMEYRDLLDLNVQFVLNSSKPFADDPTIDNLIHLKYTEPVGNWRDSNNGIGYGRIPFDVNTALVPGCLRAIADLANASIIDSSYGDAASKYAAVWEQRAIDFFEVSTSVNTLNSRISKYSDAYSLPQSLSQGEGAFNGTSFKVCDAKSSDWLFNSNGNHSFYALSLFNNSDPVRVLNSDIGAPMLYANNVSENYMKAVADSLLPFPKGLMTPIGMLVANPSMDSNTSNYATFDRTQYQGTVVWGWQMGIMANGLLRQLSFCNVSLPQLGTPEQISEVPSWCGNQQLVSSLLAGLDRLWQGIEGAKSNIYTEVWSYTYEGGGNYNHTGVLDDANDKFAVTDLGAISPTGTEADGVQLWSYGFLALLDPRSNSSSTSCSALSPPGQSNHSNQSSVPPGSSEPSQQNSGASSLAPTVLGVLLGLFALVVQA